MKHKTQNKLSILYNILILFVVLYTLTNHKSINNNTTKIHELFVEHIDLNPAQSLQNIINYFVGYIVDFVEYRKTNKERSAFFVQSEEILQELVKLRNEKAELINILQPLQDAQALFPVKYVVKLLYFISTENSRQIYFKTDENIPLNSLVFNKDCLIGRVFKKEGSNYYVLTHQDPNFRMPVYTQSTKIFGMIHGDPYKMRFVSFDEIHQFDIDENETILTASSEGKFTENIPVGKVIETKSGAFIETKCQDYYSYALII